MNALRSGVRGFHNYTKQFKVNDTTFTILGTIHYTKASQSFVTGQLEAIKPTSIVVELCPERFPERMKSVLRYDCTPEYEGVALRQDWVERQLGEMGKSMSYAKKADIPVVLGDMRISEIFKHIKSIKALGHMLAGTVMPGSESEVRQVRLHSVVNSPEIYETVIVEREKRLSRVFADSACYGDRPVLVVGMGHVDGVYERLENHFLDTPMHLAEAEEVFAKASLQFPLRCKA